MRYLLTTLLKILFAGGCLSGLGYLAHQWFDWWIAAVVAGGFAFFVPLRPGQQFATVFAAFSLLWGL